MGKCGIRTEKTKNNIYILTGHSKLLLTYYRIKIKLQCVGLFNNKSNIIVRILRNGKERFQIFRSKC